MISTDAPQYGNAPSKCTPPSQACTVFVTWQEHIDLAFFIRTMSCQPTKSIHLDLWIGKRNLLGLQPLSSQRDTAQSIPLVLEALFTSCDVIPAQRRIVVLPLTQ